MVFTVPVRMDEGPAARRTLLRAAVAGAAGLVLGGCDLVRQPTAERPAPDPLAGFYADTVSLIQRYEATRTAHATLAPRLKAVLANHRTHLAALATDMALPAASAATDATPAPSAASSVPAQPAAALAALLAAEKIAVKAAADACLAAPGWRAPLLGSIAACRASHLDLLT